MHALGALDGSEAKALDAALSALKHPSAGVRRAAVMVLPRDQTTLNALLSGKLLDDPNAQVRLAVLLALAEMPSRTSAAGAAAFAMFQQPQNAQDRWLQDALTAAGARHETGFLQAALSCRGPGAEALKVVRLVATHYAHDPASKSIFSTLAALKNASSDLAVALLEGLISGWPAGIAPTGSESDRENLAELMESLPDSARARLVELAQRWGQPEIFRTSVAPIIDSLKKKLANTSLADTQRVAAAERLVAIGDNPATVEIILQQVTLLAAPELANGLIRALAESHRSDAGKAISDHWSQ